MPRPPVPSDDAPADRTKPRLVCIAPLVPSRSADSAGGIYLALHLENLATRFDVTAFFPSEPSSGTAAGTAAGTAGPATVTMQPLPRPGLGMRLACGVAARLVGRSVLDERVLTGVFDARLRRAIGDCDAVELLFPPALGMAALLSRRRRPVPVFAMMLDRPSERWEWHELLGGGRQRWGRALHRRRLQAVEGPLARSCAVVALYKQADVDVLVPPRRAGARRPRTVLLTPPPLVDGAAHVIGSAEGTEPVALFVGPSWRSENLEGLQWFVDHVWPRVIARCPAARLDLFGMEPEHLSGSIASATKVRIVTRATSLEDAYARARVAVAPILCGAGVKSKVLDALVLRRPVVATPVAADGIVHRIGGAGFAAVTCDAEAFATATLACLNDASYAARVGDEGAAAMWTIAEWRRSMDALAEHYLEAVAQHGRRDSA